MTNLLRERDGELALLARRRADEPLDHARHEAALLQQDLDAVAARNVRQRLALRAVLVRREALRQVGRSS